MGMRQTEGISHGCRVRQASRYVISIFFWNTAYKIIISPSFLPYVDRVYACSSLSFLFAAFTLSSNISALIRDRSGVREINNDKIRPFWIGLFLEYFKSFTILGSVISFLQECSLADGSSLGFLLCLFESVADTDSWRPRGDLLSWINGTISCLSEYSWVVLPFEDGPGPLSQSVAAPRPTWTSWTYPRKM